MKIEDAGIRIESRSRMYAITWREELEIAFVAAFGVLPTRGELDEMFLSEVLRAQESTRPPVG